MISIKSQREIDIMKEAGHINYLTHQELKNALKPGITTNELNNIYNTDTKAINTLVNNGKTQLNNLINSLPENWQNRTFKNQSNTFTADGKITMSNTYTPVND